MFQAGLMLLLGMLCAAPDYPKLSPFQAVRWQAQIPEVQVEGNWYELVSLDGVSAGEIVDFCRSRHGSRWQKRFEEDLVEVLAGMGLTEWRKVELELLELPAETPVTLSDVAMTAANRQAIWRAAFERDKQRMSGAHMQRYQARDVMLSKKDCERDLRELEELMVEQFSYLKMKKVSVDKALKEARKVLKDPMPRSEFGVVVMKLLARFGDGHTRVSAHPMELFPPGHTPFLLGECGAGRVVAFHSDRSGFLDAEHPYLVAIDGRPLEDWVAALEPLQADGSEQFRRRQALRNLRLLQFARRELELPETPNVEVDLESETGERKTHTLLVVEPRPGYGDWPLRNSKILEGNVGYLRISGMESEAPFLRSLMQSMSEFRKTQGLIIDVRENGGGSRLALRTLFPFFMKNGDDPHIANVSAYRLRRGDDPKEKEGYLDNRFLYPVTSNEWDKSDVTAIKKFARKFKPEWKLPKGEFSDWHYLLLKPSGDQNYYHYDKPVIVLMDTGCFSATDIFLGAFRGWRNITLMGTASGGGSGRSRSRTLPESNFDYRLSSMASFQPTGELYDGNGIPVDVEIWPQPTDFLHGGTDSILAAALKRL
jgi:hypothetical protein